jgi:hypothetical protein
MITVTSEASHDKINIIDEEIILNGPPSDLQGHILFENKQDDMLRVKTLALVDKNKKRVADQGRSSIRMACRIRPGEQKLQTISHQLPVTTPPGTYESFLMVGKKLRKVKMVVQPSIDITINPTDFTLQDSAPGKKHTVVLTLTNMGNLPFQIPDLKHAGSLDMDMFCRAFGFGFRKNGGDGFMQSMDEVTQNIKDNLADWADVSLDEYGKIVKPGESTMLTLHLVLPRNSDPKRDYAIDLRFWDQEISFVIKSHIEKNKKASHGKKK